MFMRRAVLALFLALCSLPSVLALDAPLIRCASVDAANNVLVTWTPPADPGGDFQAFELYHATSPAGPFLLISTIPVYAQDNFLHAPTSAGTGPQFYYMRSLFASAPGFSAPSDTVATLFLEVFQSVPLGSANLAWNAPSVAFSAGPQFDVWMEYPADTWTNVGNVASTLFGYQHQISICEAFLNFRVRLVDQTGCVSFSNVDGDLFNDVTPPSTPVIDHVSVDTANGTATITWLPSPQGDTDGYIIVLSTAGGGVILDTVYGQNTITYNWPGSNADGGPESFTVAAIDSCRVGVPPSPNTSATGAVHTTVHTFLDYDPCAVIVDVNWTPYGGWPVAGYQVFVQENGGAWGLLANTSGNVLSAVHNALPQRSYCYVVKAIREGGGNSSLSNKVCLQTAYPGLPAFNYIRTVSVIGPSTIQVVDSVDVNGQVSAYRLERSANGAPFTTVALAPGTIGPLWIYNDEDVSPGNTGYRYRVVVLDSCGNEAISSNLAGSILLQTTPTLNGTSELAWNGYETWAGVLGSHVVHRSIDDGAFTPVAGLPAFPWAWSDNVQGFTAAEGRFCYYVEAREVGNPAGINAISNSNVACAVQEELVYIPNAFIIGGANPVFQPVLAYVDITAYELSIINRWGQVIWSTTDPAQAWDGLVGTRQAPVGVYGYYCAFNNGAGKRFEKRGTVTLLTAVD